MNTSPELWLGLDATSSSAGFVPLSLSEVHQSLVRGAIHYPTLDPRFVPHVLLWLQSCFICAVLRTPRNAVYRKLSVVPNFMVLGSSGVVQTENLCEVVRIELLQ